MEYQYISFKLNYLKSQINHEKFYLLKKFDRRLNF